QDIVVQHQVGDVFESDRRLVEFEIKCGGHSFKKDRLRKGADNAAAHFSFTHKMQKNYRHNVVHCHRFAEFVHRTYSIGVTVSRHAHQRLGLDDSLLERPKVLVNRFWINSAEKRIAVAANCLNLELAALQKAFDPTAA